MRWTLTPHSKPPWWQHHAASSPPRARCQIVQRVIFSSVARGRVRRKDGAWSTQSTSDPSVHGKPTANRETGVPGTQGGRGGVGEVVCPDALRQQSKPVQTYAAQLTPDSPAATAKPSTVTKPATLPAWRAASGIIESISMTSRAPAAKPLMAAWRSPEATSAMP